MSEIVQTFIHNFNDNYSQCLKAQMLYDEKKICRFSDWDITCKASDEISQETIKGMEKFIRDFFAFKYAGLILTKRSDPIYQNCHNIDKKTYLHIMAFIPKQDIAPFIDIHIDLPQGSSILKNTYTTISGQEFDDWIVITNWRKQKNGTIQCDDIKLLRPIVNEGDLTDNFFKKYFENKSDPNLRNIIKFLSP